jgi:MFS family permease
MESSEKKTKIRDLPRNIWAVSLTSFFMDISSEMVINILPLFLVNVLGVKTNIVGLIEGIAEATASLVKFFSGWLSDRLHSRKWLAVAGYGISALSKPFFLIASTWEMVAVVRWLDRAGKGIRTAPRDALVADSIEEKDRGLAFGFHRAADTAGALVGILIAAGIIWFAQANSQYLSEHTFQVVVLASLVPEACSSFAIRVRQVPITL